MTASKVKLQWGRVWLNADGGDDAYTGLTWFVASMGPRLVERGWDDAELMMSGGEFASMGPRLVERGWHDVLILVQRLAGASMGPRLVERGWISMSSSRIGGVNASMGPRLVERGWLDLVPELCVLGR